MDSHRHTLPQLFAQLGLATEPQAMDRFVATHVLPDGMPLADAPFWNASQAAFLREELKEDADWAPVVDELNTMLHH